MNFTTTEWGFNAENDECGNKYYYKIRYFLNPYPEYVNTSPPYTVSQFKNFKLTRNSEFAQTFEECVRIAQNWDSEIIRIQHE
jgi:hypothetical protein